MSATAVGWVFKHSPYKGTQLVIHLALADVANDIHDNELWLKLEKIATKARCGKSTASAALGIMADQGYLTLLAEGGGRGMPARYRFEFPDGTTQESGGSGSPNHPDPDGNHPGSDAETTQIADPPLNQTQGKTKEDPKPLRSDVEDLCNYLADAIERNGSKRPTITKGWRDAARLMIDKDDHPPEKIRKAIDWCQADAFWCANVLSMTKLRQRYDQLRLAAKREGPRKPGERPIMQNDGRDETESGRIFL